VGWIIERAVPCLSGPPMSGDKEGRKDRAPIGMNGPIPNSGKENAMTPEENATPEAEAEAQNGTATGAAQEEAPAKPLNRAERRAQAQGKTAVSDGGLLSSLRDSKVQGSKGKIPGGGQKKSFQRKV
jgi:hypothetical protein